MTVTYAGGRIAKLLTPEEIAGVLDVSPRTVRRLIERGDIRGFRVGDRRLRVSRVDFEDYLDRQREAA